MKNAEAFTAIHAESMYYMDTWDDYGILHRDTVPRTWGNF